MNQIKLVAHGSTFSQFGIGTKSFAGTYIKAPNEHSLRLLDEFPAAFQPDLMFADIAADHLLPSILLKRRKRPRAAIHQSFGTLCSGLPKRPFVQLAAF